MKTSNKSIIYNQELSTEEKTLKIKVYNYFYYMLTETNKTNIATLYILHILEIFQLISYALTEPHLSIWKIPKNTINNISNIIGGFRITTVIKYLSQNINFIIFIVLIIFNFVFILLLIIQILFRNENSKILNQFVSFTQIFIAPLTIFLYIPITEIFLSPLNCLISNLSEECWTKIQILYTVLGIISTISFLIYIIFLNFFYFYPFPIKNYNIKLNSSIDIILLIIKFVFILKNLLIKNKYISVFILLILSLFLSFEQIKNPIYSNSKIEILLYLRNNLMIWTYFIVLVGILCEGSKINGMLPLLCIGYPIVIFCSIMSFKENETEFNYQNSIFNNISSCISKTRFLINLIDSYIDNNKVNLKYNERTNQKNEILLKGFVKIHTETCLKEDCPLTKFMKNDGNFNIQKQCLLNFMSIFFNNAMKLFPYSKILKLYYIQFNFYKKYNLNSVRANLEEIKKMKSDTKEEFVVYCLENEISKMKIKEVNEGNEIEQEALVIEQNYKKLKQLISNSTKLYVEFWGIFATNITNNINMAKLYKLGEKLNKCLKELYNLWENNLKNKKIDLENENIAQLYSKFLKEVIWANKRSEEIQKKINEEHQIQGFKKIVEDHPQMDNFDSILENQDYVIFVNSNEKGKCNIIQYSNSLTYLLGYQKQNIINKPLETLMPSIFIDGHSKKVEEFIKSMHFQKNNNKDSFRGAEKKKSFILIKNKMGYLVPFNSRFTIFDDNDFSNSFLIKAQLESNDVKSTYAYYILTNPDFNIENISSSAIHLGLTMDLLKKYVIKINILIRTHKDAILNLYDKYKYFLEEQKKIIWVYPDVIYPKDDNSKNKDTPVQDLIKISQKKKFYLQIIEMKYNKEEIIGFLFKFTETQKKNQYKNRISNQELMPPFKNEILFDLLNLHYIRTIIVKNKSGFRNLRENDEENENEDMISLLSLRKKKMTKKYVHKNLEDSSEEEKVQMLLTKDKILELQTKDSNSIKSFINLLPFFGEEISLIKHRPNRERYPAGKAQEPLIKIDVSNFTRRIDLKLRENPEFYKKIKNMKIENRNIHSNENNIVSTNIITSSPNNEIDNKNNENINKDFIGNASFSLMNIFNINSTIIIKYIDFCIYFFFITTSTIEFILSYKSLTDNQIRLNYLSNNFKIINDISYIKYFITQAIMANTTKNYGFSQIDKNQYISYIKSELADYREELTNFFDEFSNIKIKYSKEYNNFFSNKTINLKTLSNGMQIEEEQPFISALNKLTTAAFYLSTMPENEAINITNKYSYELMFNLLNGYFMSFQELINILINDFTSETKKLRHLSIIIFSITIIISIIFIILFWKMMSKLDNDREKPINLFLTIKKKVFEDLKNSAESFSNKLLNKFFGNEENEEESQQEYISNVKPNDINIAKFKALNEYKASINKKSSFLFYFIQILFLFIIYNLFILLKYINATFYYRNVSKFSNIYKETQFSQISLMCQVNIFKQYLYNNTIPILTFKGEGIKYIFNNYFINMANQFGKTMIYSSKMDSFLNHQYREDYQKYVYQDISDFLRNEIKDNILKNDYVIDYIANKSENGYKQINMEIFEILRFLYINYYINNTRSDDNISQLAFDKAWYNIEILILNSVRPWYKNMFKLLDSSYISFVEDIKLIYILIYIIFIVVISLYYWIIWKKYEENFINLIKKSFDLINLIPEEIKNIIVLKLNE